jgi:DNA-directed RNA polymerase specialized sigma24 family protein
MPLLDHNSHTEDLSVNELANRCRKESAKSPQHRDTRYCFELFRRAIVGGDEAAWAAIHVQYHPLVRHWLGDVADIENLVQETFARFIQAVTAERFTAGEFPVLGSLLAFMKRTAINLRINEERRAKLERHALGDWFEQDQARMTSDYLGRVIRQELADYVRDHLKDEQERLVLRLTYEFDLRPREIAHRYPRHFKNADEVHQVKERLKKRLERDPLLRQYLD